MKKDMSEFLNYMKEAVSPYHAVEQGALLLQNEGFQELDMTRPFSIKKGGKYFVRPYQTMLFAFTIGSGVKEDQSFHIAAAHTDFPCLHIKPAAELPQKEYLRVNTEVYGGPILNTWLDRPLSIAGRVALRGKDAYHPRMVLYNAKKPVLTIPNLAIHMNQEVNKGTELKKQRDMLPLFGKISGERNEKQYFADFVAEQLGVKTEDILDFDLFVYNAEEGMLVGGKEEFLSCPRLDNQTSCYALLKGIVAGGRESGINVIALYDNEEIGSRTKQGADSSLLNMLLEKIYSAISWDKAALNEAILRSFLFSVDVAHALHPNRTDPYDPENYALMNDGIVLKINSNQRYALDTEAIAIAQMLCERAGVKYRKFVNHADIAGGGTIGSIISSWLPMKAVDVGVPILAMHSARELMGAEDESHLIWLMTEFFSEKEDDDLLTHADRQENSEVPQEEIKEGKKEKDIDNAMNHAEEQSITAKQREAEELSIVAEQREAEELSIAAKQREAEELSIAAKQREAEELKKAEELRKAEESEIKKAEERRKAEELKRSEEAETMKKEDSVESKAREAEWKKNYPWYESAVFYHIYPLGMCGVPKSRDAYQEGEKPAGHIKELEQLIPHMRHLGITALYIGPLFESEGHGYETRDYYKVDARLGDNSAFRHFVESCHAAGIRVVVDGVFNHSGRNFFAFRDLKEKREGSAYRDWYCNVNFWGNNDFNDGFSYEAWHGYNILPRLNLRNSAVKQYLLDVIRFWRKEFDIDGIRLDCADVLDFDFMKEMRSLANEIKPDFWLMGEVIHGDYSRWVNPSMLHSVTNYELHKGLFSGHNDHNYFEIAHTIRRLFDKNGGIVQGGRLYTFVENHDVTRLIDKLKDPAHIRNIYLLSYTLPGIPSIYYGGEFQLHGVQANGSDDAIRPALSLEDYAALSRRENDFISYLEMLGQAKAMLPALTGGYYEERLLTNRQYAFARCAEGQTVLVAVNNDEQSCSVTVRAEAGEYREFSGEKSMISENGSISLTLPAHGGIILTK